MDLFDYALTKTLEKEAPLAARMRPRWLSEFIGQEHIVGEGKLLQRAILSDRLFTSIILWGPPGSGKTTLAHVIANHTKSHFEILSAVLAGKNDLMRVIEGAKERRKLSQQKTILFVDEVHRWNKSQQDALLPFVENGTIIFIGATTENPYFEVISALVSRSRIFQLKPLEDQHLEAILDKALRDEERGYGKKRIIIEDDAKKHLIHISGGDARNLLNALELAVESTLPHADGTIRVTLEIAQDSIQRRAILYDKDGDAHYDTISAFIKSIRGSDPDAALYWLAKMIYAGEDPRFILRRLLILAAEDIGLADPMGLVVASAAAQAFNYIGMPEGIYPLVEAVLYLATAEKSNTTATYFSAYHIVEKEGITSIPIHLRDSHRDKKALGHGDGYKYPHQYENHYIPQQYLPKELLGTVFYQPTRQGYERMISERVEKWRQAQYEALGIIEEKIITPLSIKEIEEIKQRHYSNRGES